MPRKKEIPRPPEVEPTRLQPDAEFTAYLESTPYAAFILDMSGTIIFASAKASILTGYSNSELTGSNYHDLNMLSPKYMKQADELLVLNSTGKPTGPGEMELKKKDGSSIIIEFYSSLIYRDTGILTVVFVRDVTAHRLAEAELSVNKEYNTSLLENAPNPIVIIKEDMTVEYVNQAFEKLTGFSLSEACDVGTPFPWWPKESAGEIEKWLKQTMKTGGGKREVRFIKKNGEPFWIELNAARLMPDRNRKHLYVNWVDITERKKTEQALLDETKKANDYFEAAGTMLLALDRHGNVSRINKKGCEILEYEKEEIIGKNWVDNFIPAEMKEPIKDVFRQIIRGNLGPFQEQAGHVVLTRSGQKKYINWHNSLIRDENGKITGTLSSGEDVTERLLAEKALRESEEKFAKAFRCGPVAIAITTVPDGRYVDVNDSFCELTGYSREELIGKTAREIKLWANLKDRAKMFRLIKKRGYIENEEFEFVLKNGEVRTWLFSAEKMEIVGEECIIGKAMDITDRKMAEKALRESEEKFAKAFRSGPNPNAITTLKDGKYIDVNESYIAVTGYSREELIGKTTSEINIWANPEDRNRMIRLLEQKGKISNEEFEFRMKNGEIRTWLFSAEKMEVGGEECLIGKSTDITDRKKRAQLTAAENEVLTLMGTGADLKEVLQAIVRLCETNDLEIMASISLYDSEKGVLELSAKQSLPDEYTKMLEVGIPVGPESGSCGTAAFRCQRVIVPDIAESPLFQSYPPVIDTAIRNGLYAVWSEPIISSNGEMLGVISNYGRKTGEPEHGNIAVLEWAARIAAIAIERQRAKDALQESKEFNDSLLEYSPNEIVVINPDTSIKYVNPSWEKLNGWKKEEIIGVKIPYPWWPEEIKDAAMENFPASLSGEPGKAEIPSKKKNGELYWISMSWVPVMDGDKLKYLVVNSIDITERKKAEEALQNSNDELNDLYQNAPIAYFSVGPDGNIIRCNQRTAELLGYDTKSCIGLPMNELYAATPGSQEKAAEISARFLAGEPISDEEIELKKADGITIWVSLTVNAVRDKDGHIVESRFMAMDITERKLNEQILRTIADGSPIGVYIVQNGTFKYVNNPMKKSWGYQENETINTDVMTHIHPDDRQLVIEKSKAMLAGKITDPYEFRIVDKFGNTRHVLETVTSITYQGKRAILGNSLDITTRKTMEEELRAHRDNLEELVKVRTSELTILNKKLESELLRRTKTEKALRRATKSAEEANRAKSEFLAHMSHEIRTPIHGIMGTINLALDGQLEPEQRQYLEMAMSSADTLQNVINDILDLSKIEAGHIELTQKDFDLRTLLEEAIETVAVAAYQKGLEMTYRISPDVPTKLIGDAGRLRQVLINLLGNAVKFTSHGEIDLYTNLVSENNNEAKLHFAVRDTGIGIPPNKQKAIFDAFRQADGSINRQHGGTGLGLAISRHLVTKMGGCITVESTPGEGSTFHVTVKCAKQSPKKQTYVKPNISNSLKGMPVLVVDDNASSRKMLREILEGWQFSVAEAESGPAAISELEKIKDDSGRTPLILLDKYMPEMSGFTVAERIIPELAAPNTVVMMLPLDSVSSDFHRCQELGMSTYLVKPIKESYLLDAILQVSGNRPASEAKIVTASIRSTNRTNLRILVAEDNVTSQLVARKTLEKMGHRVTIANNGLEASRMIEKANFDLVFMDVEMPIMNGLEATRVIRKMERGKNRRLPIVAMSAFAMKEDRERCIQAGMDAYLPKPASPEDISRVINELCPPATDTSPMPAVNMDEALKVFGNDEKLFQEVAAIFLQEDYPEQLARIKESLKNRDADTLRMAAHSIKGAARSLGGLVLGDIAFRLENAGMDADFTNVEEIIAEMEAERKRFASFFPSAVANDS